MYTSLINCHRGYYTGEVESARGVRYKRWCWESQQEKGRADEEERDRKEGLQRQRPDPVGVMTHSSGWAHPETGQGRQEEEREQALSLGSEKRLMEMGGVSKSSFLPCFLADQDIIIEGAMLEVLYDHIYH